jgi:hypothetical protein
MSKFLALFQKSSGDQGDNSTLDQTARILERNRRFEFFLMQRQRDLENDLAAELPSGQATDGDDLLAMPLWADEPVALPEDAFEEMNESAEGSSALVEGFDDEIEAMLASSLQPPPPHARPGRSSTTEANSDQRNVTSGVSEAKRPASTFPSEQAQSGTAQAMGHDAGEDWSAYFNDDASEEAAGSPPHHTLVDTGETSSTETDLLALPQATIPEASRRDRYPAQAAHVADQLTTPPGDVAAGYTPERQADLMSGWNMDFGSVSEADDDFEEEPY